ncbi:MAG: sensor histidine kinase [Anaerolineae bacterium]|nr:sensor histidine kinase [Anaerolineae bacterium]
MSLRQLTLRQSLAFWTMVPMVTFGAIVLLLSFGWAWRNIQEVARDHDQSLAQALAVALGERATRGDGDTAPPCEALDELAAHARRMLYVVDVEGRVLCASPTARLSVGQVYDGIPGAANDDNSARLVPSLSARGYLVSWAPIAGTSWRLVQEEARAALVAPTYAFLIAISALMIVGLVISFWLLWLGFNRISWPLLAVTEQARRVADGAPFVPPDVVGPAEVEALVAAFNHMVTQLRQQRDILHEYATRMLHSQEEERKRLSRDLHDETAQELVGLLQRIDLCRLTAEDDPPIMDALDELSTLTDRALSGVRRMSRALRPLILEDLGLVVALQAIAEDLEQQLSGGRVYCEVIGEEQRLSPEAELTAFRIVQEALTNVRKHAAEATRVYVTVQFRPHALHVSVEDNGQGFHPQRVDAEEGEDHLGLMGMRERAELLNGTWSIESRPGEGTRVDLVLPIP